MTPTRSISERARGACSSTALLLCATALLAAAGCGGNSPPPSTGTVAGQLVISNGDASIASCAVATDGEIESCLLRDVPYLGTPGGLDVASGRVYVADLGESAIAVCDVDTGEAPTACAMPQQGGPLVAPMGVVAAGGRLFVSNGDGAIVACDLDDAGAPQSCQVAAPAGTFDNPMGLAAYDRFLLVANQRRNTIAVCDATRSTLDCTAYDGGGKFAHPTGLTVAGDRAYVSNVADDSLTVCRIGGDGALGGCVKSVHAAALSWPLDVAVNGSVLYVSNAGTHSLAICDVRPNGNVTHCEDGAAGDLFLYPNGITFVAEAS